MDVPGKLFAKLPLFTACFLVYIRFMTERSEALTAVQAQVAAARLAARETKKPKKARRLRAWAAALERGAAVVERQLHQPVPKQR